MNVKIKLLALIQSYLIENIPALKVLVENSAKMYKNFMQKHVDKSFR